MNYPADYAEAVLSADDMRLNEFVKAVARRIPGPCNHTKKRLSDIWQGEVIDYHIMRCDCGMAQVWPVDHHTGKILMNNDFSYLSDDYFFIQKASKIDETNCYNHTDT